MLGKGCSVLIRHQHGPGVWSVDCQGAPYACLHNLCMTTCKCTSEHAQTMLNVHVAPTQCSPRALRNSARHRCIWFRWFVRSRLGCCRRKTVDCAQSAGLRGIPGGVVWGSGRRQLQSCLASSARPTKGPGIALKVGNDRLASFQCRWASVLDLRTA